MGNRVKATKFQAVTISSDDMAIVAQGLHEAAKFCNERASSLANAGHADAATVYRNSAKAYQSLARSFAQAGKD